MSSEATNNLTFRQIQCDVVIEFGVKILDLGDLATSAVSPEKDSKDWPQARGTRTTCCLFEPSIRHDKMMMAFGNATESDCVRVSPQIEAFGHRCCKTAVEMEGHCQDPKITWSQIVQQKERCT